MQEVFKFTTLSISILFFLGCCRQTAIRDTGVTIKNSDSSVEVGNGRVLLALSWDSSMVKQEYFL